MFAALSSLDLSAMTHPLCTVNPQRKVVWKQHLVPHCQGRPDVLLWVPPAPVRSCHCTHKPQPLKGQRCSKSIFTNITRALCFTHPPSLLTSLCAFCTCGRVIRMADKNHRREGVFYQPCFCKGKF